MTMVFSQAVVDEYKKIQDATDPSNQRKDIRRKNLKGLMQESFFHGAGWMGYNFVA